MQDFMYKTNEDGTYAIIGYNGDAPVVTVPMLNPSRPVTVLFDRVFAGHREIRQIVLPDSLTDIGCQVFDGCEQLKTIALPQGIRYLWQYAFQRSGIEEIEIPGSVLGIVPFTFMDCTALRRVVLHRGTRKINAWAFQNCTQLETVEVPEETEIHPEAFLGCSEKLKICRK